MGEALRRPSVRTQDGQHHGNDEDHDAGDQHQIDDARVTILVLLSTGLAGVELTRDRGCRNHGVVSGLHPQVPEERAREHDKRQRGTDPSARSHHHKLS